MKELTKPQFLEQNKEWLASCPLYLRMALTKSIVHTFLHVLGLFYALTNVVLVTFSSFGHKGTMQARSKIAEAEGIFPAQEEELFVYCDDLPSQFGINACHDFVEARKQGARCKDARTVGATIDDDE
jgi:hypothetical protein